VIPSRRLAGGHVFARSTHRLLADDIHPALEVRHPVRWNDDCRPGTTDAAFVRSNISDGN
jgi:hypothetical protein